MNLERSILFLATMTHKENQKEMDIFQTQLMEWYQQHDRPLPWKEEKDPYLIWLSEIILQQTRVAQGLPYFEKFKTNYPDVTSLANASSDEVMKLWEGLGYYSRARNMHATAKFISQELNGKFPATYKEILSLKGVGPYTAAAISSFAFDLPHAVVDGNVYRVLARYFGIDTPIDQTQGKKRFAELAQALLDTSQPGRYNQAIMDFGAVQCVPKSPKCKACPLQDCCHAFQEDQIQRYPVKSKKLVKKDRFFHFLVFDYEGSTFVQKREAKDIWLHLYQFPLVESNQFIKTFSALQEQLDWPAWIDEGSIKEWSLSRPFKQELTHQRIHAFFFKIHLKTPPESIPSEFVITERENLTKFAFPKIIDLYLKDNSLYLKLL